MTDMIEWLREGAELVLRDQEQLGLVLDGSLESIACIEAYLDDLRAGHGRDRDAEDIYRIVLGLGVYLGEVIIEESGAAEWAANSEDPDDPWLAHVVGTGSEYQVSPLGKVLKRYESGAGESLVEFATLAIAMFRGEFGFVTRTLH